MASMLLRAVLVAELPVLAAGNSLPFDTSLLAIERRPARLNEIGVALNFVEGDWPMISEAALAAFHRSRRALGASVAYAKASGSACVPAAVGILLAVGYLAASAVTCIPPPGTDPYMFVGAAVRYSRGLGLTTPFYPTQVRGEARGFLNDDQYAYLSRQVRELARHDDPTHSGTLAPLGKARLVAYTPLFHWIAGALTPTPDPWGVFLVVAGMRAAQVLVWAWLFAALVRRAAPCLRWRWVIPLLLVGMVSQNGTPTEGRPEALVGLLQAVGAALVVLLPSAWHPVTLGVVLGLIGAAHPVAAILSAGAVAVYAAFRARLAGGVGFLAVTGMVSLAVFTGLLAVSPNGLAPTIRGTLALSKIGIIPAWGDWWSFYGLAGRTPFSGVWLASGRDRCRPATHCLRSCLVPAPCGNFQ